MTMKWMKRMTTIQIGHKVLLLLFAFMVSGCWVFEMDGSGKYSYTSYILNGSSDTLRIYISNESATYEMDTTLPQNMEVRYVGGVHVKEGDDVLSDHLFVDYYNSNIVRIYRSDSLLLTWEGPAEDMGDSVHHFYNYDSWNVELVDDKYILEFTLNDTDLN